MTHLLVIALLVIPAVRSLGDPDLPAAAWIRDHPAGAVAAALTPFAALVTLQLFSALRCLRRVNRHTDPAAINRFERDSARIRLATLPLQASAVFLFGWLDTIRTLTGDLIAIDEVLAAVPAFAVLLIGWATAEPVERRVREALLIRRLDEGLLVPPMPRPLTWWWGTVRQQFLFAAAPVTLILAWSETIERLRNGLWDRSLADGPWGIEGPAWADNAPAWLLDRDVIVYGSAGLQIAGVLVLLAFLPLALRYLWDTVPLGPGALRDSLLDLCRKHGVRVRGILIWRTHGAMINGAVVGFLPRLRYIILTDTLLESLPREQIEAVAAHEVAHARHRHIPWLALTMVCTGLFLGSVLSIAARLAGLDASGEGWYPLGILAVVFTVSILLFGWTSRRFEWQADVFAAQHCSASPDPAQHVTETGAAAMSGALRAVALINGFPAERFTFRHGSIDARRARIAQAVGEPIARSTADRAARVVKRTVLALGVLGLALAVAETVATQQF